jgi:hypothetical protein
MYKLIEHVSGAEVKPGMNLLDFRSRMFKFVSFRVLSAPSTGRVLVTDIEGGQEHEFYPEVFGLNIVQDSPDGAVYKAPVQLSLFTGGGNGTR